MQPPLAPCGSAIQRFPSIPYLRATAYQPPDLAPIYSARSVRSSSLALNLNGSSSVPMMMSGPAPTFAATADFGRISSQLSASTRTLTPDLSANFFVLATKLSNSAWMNCFQRKTRICAPASGGGPLQVGAAVAGRDPRRPRPAAAAPAPKIPRRGVSPMAASRFRAPSVSGDGVSAICPPVFVAVKAWRETPANLPQSKADGPTAPANGPASRT